MKVKTCYYYITQCVSRCMCKRFIVVFAELHMCNTSKFSGLYKSRELVRLQVYDEIKESTLRNVAELTNRVHCNSQH